MSPQSIGADIIRTDVEPLRESQAVGDALRAVLASGLPALPVVDDQDRLVGIFGEREFMSALFPGYLSQLDYAAFVPRSLDESLERRIGCAAEELREHVNREHVDVPTDFSDAQLAETFLHHRVLIIPVTEAGVVQGVISRSDFFRRLAERVLERQD